VKNKAYLAECLDGSPSALLWLDVTMDWLIVTERSGREPEEFGSPLLGLL
jgi:hypothetical protein